MMPVNIRICKLSCGPHFVAVNTILSFPHKKFIMKITASFISGLAGSIVLTGLHQLLRGRLSDAPRMDKLGEQAIQKGADAIGVEAPAGEKLYNTTMAADLAGNAIYYSMVGTFPASSVVAGVALGATAGVGALMLPEKMGLNPEYSNKTARTQILTCGLYLTAGLVAGLVYQALDPDGEN